MKNLNIILITIAGLGFLGFGIVLLCWPDMALPGVGIQALTDQAQVEVRAFYGGLEIGLGLLLLSCFAPSRQRFGVQLCLASYGAIGLARAAGMLALGVTTPFLWFALAWEASIAVLALVALRGETPDR